MLQQPSKTCWQNLDPRYEKEKDDVTCWDFHNPLLFPCCWDLAHSVKFSKLRLVLHINAQHITQPWSAKCPKRRLFWKISKWCLKLGYLLLMSFSRLEYQFELKNGVDWKCFHIKRWIFKKDSFEFLWCLCLQRVYKSGDTQIMALRSQASHQ